MLKKELSQLQCEHLYTPCLTFNSHMQIVTPMPPGMQPEATNMWCRTPLFARSVYLLLYSVEMLNLQQHSQALCSANLTPQIWTITRATLHHAVLMYQTSTLDLMSMLWSLLYMHVLETDRLHLQRCKLLVRISNSCQGKTRACRVHTVHD